MLTKAYLLTGGFEFWKQLHNHCVQNNCGAHETSL